MYLGSTNNTWGLCTKTTGKEDERLLISDEKRVIYDYLWATDTYVVYFQYVRGTLDRILYRLNLETGETKRLTPSKNVEVLCISYNKLFPDELIISMNKDTPEYHDLYHINISSGEITLIAKNSGNVIEWLINSNLKLQGMILYTNDGFYELMVREDENSDWEKLLLWDMEDRPLSQFITFSEDNRHIYLTDSRNENTCRLIKIEISTGNTEVIAHDMTYDIIYITTNEVLINPVTHEIQAICYDKGRKEWLILDETIKEDFKIIKKLDYGDIYIINRDKNDEIWLISFIKDNGPTSYYAFNRTSKKGTFLFHSQPSLNDYILSPVEEISFTSRDGLTIHGYITCPVEISKNNLPLVIYVRRNACCHDTWEYNPTVQWLANRGYACLQINFRGSMGYGKDFLKAGYKEWGGKMHYDIVDAVNWAIKKGIADRDRIAIYGSAYGGYEALVGASFTPDLFCCAIAINCPSNLITLMESLSSCMKVYRNILIKRIGNPETEKDFLISRSPFYKADQIKIPLLVSHNLNNPRVKSDESYQMIKAMRGKGIEAEYVVFPNEGNMVTPKSLIKFHFIAEKFLANYLGGRIEERKLCIQEKNIIISNDEELNEKKLIDKILIERDKRAFDKLAEYYRKPLMKYLLNITGNLELSKELFQETFLKVWLYMESYCFEMPFSSWLFKIATNETRKRWKTNNLPDKISLYEINSDILQDGWEEDVEDKILYSSVFNSLKEPYRTSIILRFIHDMSYNDIAFIMGKTPQQIKNYLFRARKSLIPLLDTPDKSQQMP